MTRLAYYLIAIVFGLILIGTAGAEDSSTAESARESTPRGVLSGDSVPQFTEEHRGKSADEVAKALANPNNSLASLTLKNQFRWYTGDLPNADDQSNYTLLFQPVFPFSLAPTASGGKANLFIRPAIPLLVDQPVFDAQSMDFSGVTALGDIGFDIGIGVTEKSGWL